MRKRSDMLQLQEKKRRNNRLQLWKTLANETCFSLILSLYIAKKAISSGLLLPGLSEVTKLTVKLDQRELLHYLDDLKAVELITQTKTPGGSLYELTPEGVRIFSSLLGNDKKRMKRFISKLKADFAEKAEQR